MSAVHESKLISVRQTDWRDLTDNNLSPCVLLESIEFPSDDLFTDIVFGEHDDLEKDNKCLKYVYGYRQKLNDELRDLKTINRSLTNSEETKFIIDVLRWLAEDEQLSKIIDKYTITRNALAEHELELFEKTKRLSENIPSVISEKSDFHKFRKRVCEITAALSKC